MKTVKYLLIGALTLSVGTPVSAQDNKSTIASITNIIKSKPADIDKQAKAFLKDNKKNPEVLVGVGRAFYDVKDTAQARVFANAAIARDKKCAPAFLLLGDIEAMSNDGGTAAQQYEQAIYANPKDPEAYYRYAAVYRKVSPAGAVAKLEELRAQRPDIAVDAKAGHIYYLSNRFDKAIECYDKSWNADKAKMETSDLSEYAMSLYFTQNNKRSLEVVQFGLTKEPRNAAFNRLAFFNSTDLKDYDTALNYADALFNKSDSAKFSYFDYTYYGNAYNGKKDYNKAIEMYNKALTMDIDNKDKRAGVVKQLSDAYQNMEDYDNAIKYYEEYIKTISKASAADKAGLASLYEYKADGEKDVAAKTANFKKAEEIYAQMEQEYPNAAEYAIFKRARVNLYMDPDSKNGLAKPYYEKLVGIIEPRAEKDKTDKTRLIESYSYLGSYYWLVQNDKAQGDIYWNKILQLDPTNERAQKALGVK